jgi:outer membrane protein OmpA-like peptidoglycan-associated protein
MSKASDLKLIAEAYKIVREQTFSRATPGGGSESGYYNSSGQPVITQSKPGAVDQPGFGYFVDGSRQQPPAGGFNMITATPGGDKIEINDDVLFQFGTSEFVSGAEAKLADIAGKIKQVQRSIDPVTKIQVVGHTDAYELKPGINLPLSQQRAKRVQEVLQKNGITLPISSTGVGSQQLKVQLPNSPQYQIRGQKAPDMGRQQQQPNRRVELKFTPPLDRKIITQIAPPARIGTGTLTNPPAPVAGGYLTMFDNPEGAKPAHPQSTPLR